MSPAQRASYANDHLSKIPFETSPRHLAGPGDPRHVTHALLAAGWKITSAPGDVRLTLRGPDHTPHRLESDPLSATSAWWRIHGNNQAWYAEFGPMIPAEMLAGFTDRLLDDAPTLKAGPWERMAQAGWAVERCSDGTGIAVSPDGVLHAELRPVTEDVPDHRAWCIEARPEREGPAWWHAWISGPVPEYLVDGLVEQLLSTAPVVRGMFTLDHPSARQYPSPLTPEQVAEAHFQRLDTLTAQARARQRAHRQTTNAPTFPALSSPVPPAARASAQHR